jgi:hypothetical protein
MFDLDSTSTSAELVVGNAPDQKSYTKQKIDDNKWIELIRNYEIIPNTSIHQLQKGDHIRYERRDGARRRGGYVNYHWVGKTGSQLGKKIVQLVQNLYRPPNAHNNITWSVKYDDIATCWKKNNNPNSNDNGDIHYQNPQPLQPFADTSQLSQLSQLSIQPTQNIDSEISLLKSRIGILEDELKQQKDKMVRVINLMQVVMRKQQ